MQRKERITVDWPAKAARLAGRFPLERLHPAVLAWTGDRRGAAARRPWAVAFSGGADSLCLLLLLRAHWPRRRLVALHFNHRLRGAESNRDERFCRDVCAALDVPLRVGRWRRPGREVSEKEAREARFAFFEQAMRRAGALSLWLGHQQNDIAETMLMRLARGSGAAGLAAPRPVQTVSGRVHLRPLLTLKKEEIAAALRAASARWRRDRTNSGGRFFRNRIRRAVLPAWRRAAERDALAGAALARGLLEEDETALEIWLRELRPLRRDGVLDVTRLAGRPRALMRRALRQWLAGQPLAAELSRQGFENLLEAAIRGRPARRSLGVHGFAVLRGGRLRFARVKTRKSRVKKADQFQTRTCRNP